MNPRMLRIKDAALYLGVSDSYFRKSLRHQLKERKWSGVSVFDRLEIDDYINRMNLEEDRKKADTDSGNMRAKQKGVAKCPQKTSRAYTKGTEHGTSTSSIAVSEFDKAVLQIVGKKRKAS